MLKFSYIRHLVAVSFLWTTWLVMGGSSHAQQPTTRPSVKVRSPLRPTFPSPSVTLGGAERFMKQAEQEILRLWINTSRLAFLHDTFINDDTQLLYTQAQEEMMEYFARQSKAAMRFYTLQLPKELARKLALLRLSIELPAPSDPTARKELATLSTWLSATYGKGKYCKTKTKCMDLQQLSAILASSRNYDELLEAWKGWRTISVPMRSRYERYVQLANRGAQEIGFADLGAMWRTRYDMSPEQFSAEMERLWQQVKPLYRDLHCYVRAKLVQHYGAKKVPPKGLIPAHLLGNMWSQSWDNIYSLVAPKDGNQTSFDMDRYLKEKKLTPQEMVKIAERFFISLGMPALPKSFWKRSMFTKPRDREVVCHASAWHIDYDQDVRLKQCIKIDTEDLYTLHHELGHLYYYLAYRQQSPLFRSGAHDGFHEGVGDAISLSMTPGYYKQIGLLPAHVKPPADVPFLLKMALERVAFLPFGKLIDQWRWGVFRGKIPPSQYNRAWWELRRRYQGIAAPVARSEQDFDPGAKYHIPANVPYSRYFLAAILQFQFHRSMCQLAGHRGPLHTCSFFGNRAAGQRMWNMLRLGQSRPWPEILKILTGQRDMDASAILSYFAPLHRWLKEQNKNNTCGW